MTSHSRSTILILAGFVLLVGGAFIYKRPPPTIIPPFDVKCGCYCHKAHELEMKKILHSIEEDRALLKKEKRIESEKIMKDQEEYCSQPFRVFLEEYGKPSLPH